MKEKENATKIALVGTSCVGKTTLLESLKLDHENNPRAVFVPEAAREFFINNPQVTDRFSEVTQEQIQSLVLQKEQQAHEQGARLIVCDRSVIDAVVYVRSTGDKDGANRLFERVLYWLPTYKIFLLLDPEDIAYKKDDIRKEDETTRQRFHEAFMEFFLEKNLPFELVSGNPEQRIARVKQLLIK